MYKPKLVMVDRGPGVSKLAETLGGLGQLRLGVMDEKAAEAHPNSELTVGEVAAVWELGLVPGQPKRSWLGAWMDQNQERMVAEARAALQEVIKGHLTRKRAFEMLGYKWASEIRQNIAAGGVQPPISPMTARLKGHAIPLYDSHAIHNAVGYKIFLPHWKNVPGGSAQGAGDMALAKTIIASSPVGGSPQPPDKPVMFGPKENRNARRARKMLAAGLINERQFQLAIGPRAKLGKKVKFLGKSRPVSGTAKTVSAFKPKKGRKPALPKVKVSKARRLPKARARAARGYAREQMKASWAAKWLRKLARKLIKGNHRQKIHR